jgi:hypothetical protein
MRVVCGSRELRDPLSNCGVVVQLGQDSGPGCQKSKVRILAAPPSQSREDPRSKLAAKTGPWAILAPFSDIRVRTRDPRSKRALELQRGSRASNVVVLLRIRTTTFQKQRKTVGDRGRSVLTKIPSNRVQRVSSQRLQNLYVTFPCFFSRHVTNPLRSD